MMKLKNYITMTFLTATLNSCVSHIHLTFNNPEFPEGRILHFPKEIIGSYKNPFQRDGRILSIRDSSITIPTSIVLSLEEFYHIENTQNFDFVKKNDSLNFILKPYIILALNTDEVLFAKKEGYYFLSLKVKYNDSSTWRIFVIDRMNNKILKITSLDVVLNKKELNDFFKLDSLSKDAFRVNEIKKPYFKLFRKGYFTRTSLWQK